MPGTPVRKPTDPPTAEETGPALPAEEKTFNRRKSATTQTTVSPLFKYQAGWLASNALYQSRQEQQYSHASIVSASTLPLPNAGFGAYSTLTPSQRLSVTAGIHEDVLHRLNSENVDRNAYFYALGIDYSPELANSPAQQYQLTLWRRQLFDQGAQSSGFALKVAKQFDHRIDWSPFLNLSYRDDGNNGDATTVAAAGIDLMRLPWNPRGGTGIAYAHEQSDSTERGIHSLEVYYRLPLTPYLEVTPDMQISYQKNRSAGIQQSLASSIHFRLLF